MPKKRHPGEVTQQDVEELKKVTTGLQKREIKYPESGGGELILKDVCKITYPESQGGEMLVKKEGTIDTHRVELKKIRSVPTVKIARPEDAVKFVRELENSDRERFVVIWLDTKNRVIGVENVSTGSISQAVVHPREAAKGAILANASGVILVHNHPSGIPEPSLEDDELVAKLRDVFKLVGIKVLDAIIIGKEGYYSYFVQNRLDRQITGGVERLMEDEAFRRYEKAVKQIGGADAYIRAGMEKDAEACAMALKAAAMTLEKHCKPSKCYILLGTVASAIEMKYLKPKESQYGLFFKQLHTVDVELSKKEGNILYCQGHVDFKYREDNEDYKGFRGLLESIRKDVSTESFINIVNEDVLKERRLTILEIVLADIEPEPHFYDPDEGKVTLSLLIKGEDYGK